MTNYDPYAEAREVAAMLSSEGQPTAAAKILDALTYGSTGTEIVMSLATELAELASLSELSPQLRRKAAALRTRLDELFR